MTIVAILIGLGFTLFTALLVIMADTALKIAADAGAGLRHPYVVMGCLAYAVSALLWFGAVRQITLAQAGVAYAMLSLLALCAIGTIYFDEPFGPREAAGIICALAAMLLFFRVV